MKNYGNMKIIGKNTKTLSFSSLLQFPKLVHGYSTRLGGVSEDIYSQLNLSFTRGDKKENVLQNYLLWAEDLNIPMERIVVAAQTHSNHIRIVTSQDAGKGVIYRQDFEEVDGLITVEKNLPLCTLHADCIPIFFYDPIQEVIGVAHSGWRGSHLKIGALMITTMEKKFRSRAGDVYVGIGPGIGRECYEVSREVAEVFEQDFPHTSQYFLEKNSSGKYQLDLMRCIYESLKGVGVLEEHIEISNICTSCNHEILFSHRKSMGKRGNNGAIIMLRK